MFGNISISMSPDLDVCGLWIVTVSDEFMTNEKP